MKRIAAFLLALLVAAQAYGACTTGNCPPSSLPVASALTGAESIPADQSGSCSATGGTCQTTPAQLTTYVQANAVIPLATGVSGNLPATNLPSIASSTVLGNFSGSTAAASALTPLAVQNMGNFVPGASYVQTVNLATLSGSQTLTLPTGATVTSPNGAVVLLVAQTTASQNGLWIVNTSTAWTRPQWFPSGAVIPANCSYLVLDLFTGTRWYENDVFGGTAVTIDTSNQTWTAIGTYVFGNGAAILEAAAKLAAGAANTLTLKGGSSFNATGAGAGSGANLNLFGGSATTTATTGTENGGSVNVTAAGGGGAAGASATNGGGVTFTAGGGGSSTTQANGGSISFIAGQGSSTANGNGGTINFRPGSNSGSGTGTNGTITFQDYNTNPVGSLTSDGFQMQVATVATLPACGSGVVSHFAVSDATAASYHGALTGGGTVFTPVACINGTWVAD